MNDEYINFGDVARGQMGQQCQYASRYFCQNWKDEYPMLGVGLRIKGNSNDYHSMMIHKDDVVVAVERYKKHQGERNNLN